VGISHGSCHALAKLVNSWVQQHEPISYRLTIVDMCYITVGLFNGHQLRSSEKEPLVLVIGHGWILSGEFHYTVPPWISIFKREKGSWNDSLHPNPRSFGLTLFKQIYRIDPFQYLLLLWGLEEIEVLLKMILFCLEKLSYTKLTLSNVLSLCYKVWKKRRFYWNDFFRWM
jgi:hypothetical protein